MHVCNCDNRLQAYPGAMLCENCGGIIENSEEYVGVDQGSGDETVVDVKYSGAQTGRFTSQSNAQVVVQKAVRAGRVKETLEALRNAASAGLISAQAAADALAKLGGGKDTYQS